MSFGNFLGGMGVTAAAFQDGRERVMDLQEKEDANGYNKQVREANRGLIPLKTEATRTQLQSQLDEQKHKDTLAPTRRSVETQVANAEAELVPGKIDAARKQQQLDLDKLAFEAVDQSIKGITTKEAGRQNLSALVGERLSGNDLEGAVRLFRHMQNSPIFPEFSGMPAAVSAKPTKAKLEDGTEINALELTLRDGSTHVLNPNHAIALYKKRQLDADTAAAKIVKPGEKWQTPAGRVLAEGNERSYSGTMVQDEDGNWINMRTGGAGGTGGTGSRAGAKPPPTAEANALSAFEVIYKNANTKLEANQLADGQDYVVRAMRSGAQTPEIAARIALDAVTNPTRIQPDLDAKTGEWSGVYRNPDIQAGTPFTLSKGSRTAAELAKEKGGEAVVKDGVLKMLDAQGALLAPGQPEAHAAIRDVWLQAAHDPVRRKQLEDGALARGGQASLAEVSRKLDMIRDFGPKLPAKRAGAAAAPSSGPERFEPKEGTPPEIAARMRERGAAAGVTDTKRETDRKADDERRARETEQAKQSVAWVTPEAIKVLSGKEARDIRNGPGWRHLDSARQRLLTIQAGRSD